MHNIYEGLPERIFFVFPKPLIEKLDASIKYTPQVVFEIIAKYFIDQSIEDIARLYYLDKWKLDIDNRRMKTFNLDEFLNRELIKNTTDIENSEGLSGSAKYNQYSDFRRKGYHSAIDGENLLVTDFIMTYTDKYEHYRWDNIRELFERLRQFCKGYTHAMISQYIRTIQLDVNKNSINLTSPRLNWKGTPAQLGFLIQELIGKGYLEKPTKSYAKDAEHYLQMFSIDTTAATLAKEISEKGNSLSATNSMQFKIPPIEKLK